jgi:Cys-rich repeat protein
MICVDGECKNAPCKNDADCPPGTVCVDGKCIVVPCSSDKDCPPGTKCVNGKCVPTGCNDDEDCPEGYICVDGKCVPKGCSLDADCPPGFVCIDGVCQRPPGGPVMDEQDYVGCLTKIDVISTGIGYSPEDSITIEPNIPGLDVKVQMTEMGQIVAMTVVNGYCGLTGIPTIIINSKNGSGAEFRARVEFTRGSEFKGDLQGEVIKVIDCVYK